MTEPWTQARQEAAKVRDCNEYPCISEDDSRDILAFVDELVEAVERGRTQRAQSGRVFETPAESIVRRYREGCA